MAEDLLIDKEASKEDRYKQLMPQVKALIGDETDMVANMANMAAALHQSFSFLWTGFYIVRDEVLVLGPFQGPVACTRIEHGRGVCGTAWAEARTIVVPDVEAFPGHIACSTLSKSEIVVPLKDEQGEVIGVLDIDSSERDSFNAEDQAALEDLCTYLGNRE